MVKYINGCWNLDLTENSGQVYLKHYGPVRLTPKKFVSGDYYYYKDYPIM